MTPSIYPSRPKTRAIDLILKAANNPSAMRNEMEANAFAVELLIPAEFLIQRLGIIWMSPRASFSWLPSSASSSEAWAGDMRKSASGAAQSTGTGGTWAWKIAAKEIASNLPAAAQPQPPKGEGA